MCIRDSRCAPFGGGEEVIHRRCQAPPVAAATTEGVGIRARRRGGEENHVAWRERDVVWLGECATRLHLNVTVPGRQRRGARGLAEQRGTEVEREHVLEPL